MGKKNEYLKHGRVWNVEDVSGTGKKLGGGGGEKLCLLNKHREY